MREPRHMIQPHAAVRGRLVEEGTASHFPVCSEDPAGLHLGIIIKFIIMKFSLREYVQTIQFRKMEA